MSQTFQPVPVMYGDEVEHRRQIATKLNQVNQAKFNCTIELTLKVSASTTTLFDARISPFSYLGFMPTTSHAAQEISAGTLYIPESTMLNGSAIIQHANNAQADRIFRVGIFG